MNYSVSQVYFDIICWNCDTSGHTFNQCKISLKCFCFKCGRKNFTTSSRLECSKNERVGRNQVGISDQYDRQQVPTTTQKGRHRISKN